MSKNIKEELIGEMALFLSTNEIDLGDERAVIRALTGHGYRSGEVVAFLDDAIERARIRNASVKFMEL